MAKGRMLAWRISESLKVNSLSGPWPMLLYTWLIPHYDNLGRFHGEPCRVRALVLPRQKVTDEQVAEWLSEISAAGLLHWYEVDGLKYLSMSKEVWEREQVIHPKASRNSNFPPFRETSRKLREITGDSSPELEYEVELESESESEKEVELESEVERAEKNPVNPVRKRTFNGKNHGPAFWNRADVQEALQRLRNAGSDDESAKSLVVSHFATLEGV